MYKSPIDYLCLCQRVSAKVKSGLVKRLSKNGFVGNTTINPSDLKSTHDIDTLAVEIITKELRDHRCNIFMESCEGTTIEDADFSIFIDPIDGSLNWDRGVGDPCIAIAITEKLEDIRFNDLSVSYVEGFRSGDYYFTQEGKSFFVSKTTGKRYENRCRENQPLSNATCYLRPGYSLAKTAFEGSFCLFLECGDIRAFENSAMELCEIARNAADLMVETRKASDFYNLLAYPILKNAGGLVCDLGGRDIGELVIDAKKTYDFIACNNPLLLQEALSVLQDYWKSRAYCKDNLQFRF